jgi:photosystem II stability/assembly factor-like uncharacterized protein
MKTLIVFILFVGRLAYSQQHLPQAAEGWQKQESGTQENLKWVRFFSHTNGWAVGEQGNAYRTTNAGEQWILHIPPAGYEFQYFMNETTAFANGTSPDQLHSTIIRTTDMGQSWSEPDSYDRELTAHPDMANIGDTVFQLNDQNFLRSFDGGKSWGKTFSAISYETSCTFTDGKKGYAVGLKIPSSHGSNQYGGFAFTTNSGGEWHAVESLLGHDLFDICAVGNKLFTVGTEELLAYSTSAGAFWDKIPPIDNTNQVYKSITFSDPRNGTVVGSGGYVLRTTDGGITWNRQQSNVGQWLLSVSFVDSVTGWAVGNSGTIIHTSNGGQSSVLPQLPGLETIPSQVFPQPNSGIMNLSFVLPSPQHITLEIFSVSGSMIQKVIDSEYRTAGEHTIPIQLPQLASGQYSYRIRTSTYQSVGYFTIVK